MNRNGINLCYNKNNEIVCAYLFYLYDDIYINDVTYNNIDLFKNSNIKIDIEKELNKLNKKINNEECNICKDEIEEGIELKCLHVFHKICVKEWFNINQTCPLCRTSFIDKIIKLIKIEEKFDLENFKNYILEDKIIQNIKFNKYNNGINKIIF